MNIRGKHAPTGLGCLTAAVCCTALLTACSPDTSLGDSPDTALEEGYNARFRFHSDLYRPAPGMQTPPRGKSLQTAPFVDCDRNTLPEMGEATLFAVPGHDPATLAIVAEENGDAVYINENIPWSERPQLVKESDQYLTCSGPARFVGNWRWIDPEDMPNMEDYDSARVPYTGNFTTRTGSGVQLDRWAQVTLQAEITADTQPVPSPHFIEQATSGDAPVTVTTTCRGNRFEVATIRLVN